MLLFLVGFYACQSPSSCGNEVHKVAPKKVASGGGVRSCGNESHKVKKKKKVRKKDMGLFGKGENPYRRN